MERLEPPLTGVLVGCGYTSGFQLMAWSRIESAQIAGLSSLHSADAEKRAAEYNVPAVYDDYATMLDKIRPDFTDIATPAGTHLELVTIAAERGVHVLCQKPMAPSQSDIDSMIRVCQQNGVSLTVNENARFQPWFRELGRIVKRGTLGQLRLLQIDSRAQITLPSPDFGEQQHLVNEERLIIMDLGVHHLDVARFLLGEVHSVFAVTQQISSEVAGEDQAFILTNHQDANATINMSWSAAPYPPTQQVTWSTVRLEGDRRTALLSYGGLLEVWTPQGLMSRVQFSEDGVQEGYEGMQRHFIERLISGVPAETDGIQTARTMELVFGAYESADSGDVVKTSTNSQSNVDD